MTTVCKHERGKNTRGCTVTGRQAVASHARNYPMSSDLHTKILSVQESVSVYALNTDRRMYEQFADAALAYMLSSEFSSKQAAVNQLGVRGSYPSAKMTTTNLVDAQDTIKTMTPDDELIAQSGLTQEEINSIDTIAESILNQFGVAVEYSKVWLDVWTEAEPTVNKELYIQGADVVDMEWAFTRALIEADTPAIRKNKYLIHFMPIAE